MVRDGESKLKALSDIASIDISMDFDRILESILKITCETMNAHSGTIMLVDEDTKDIRMVAKCGLPEDYIERVYRAAEDAGVPLSSSPSGIVLKTGQYYVVPNLFEEPKDLPWMDLSRELSFSSQIFTPMKSGLEVIGLLNVYMADVHQFTEEEINFVTIAASQASSVVQNARMCSRLTSNVRELKDYKENLEEKLKESHKKLYSSEKYLRAVIESSFDGILVVDELGRFEFGNNSAFNILGWPREELIGQFFMKVFPEDMKDFMQERWHEIQNGIEGVYETKIIKQNGDIQYIYVSHALAEIHGVRKYVVVFKDITDYKKLVSNLKESEKKYRELFENADDPMYIHDIRGYFLKINRTGAGILGGNEEEIIGTHISKWLTPESYKLFLDRVAKINEGQVLEQPAIIEVICRNGEHKWGESRTRLIKEGDRIIGTHGIVRDITEKKKMELQLKEYNEKLERSYDALLISEAQFRELFDNASDCIYTIDLDGQFLTVNNALIKAMKCNSHEEFLASNMSIWMTPESFEKAKKFIHEVITEEDYYNKSVVIEIIRKDGKHVWFEHKARPIKDNNNKIIGLHGMGRDVTEKMDLEKKLRDYTQKLEESYTQLMEADRIKTEFTSNITHELLTPLTSIKGFVELLDDGTMGKIDNEQKKSLEIILRNTERLIQLIKELLDVANLEKNLFGLKFGLVSMNNILSKSIQNIYPQAKSKNITIIQDINQLPHIWGDEERLSQVISNLLINAVKFTPQNGKVTVKAREESDRIRINIADTGIGIPQDKLLNIFDKFYQVDGSTRRKYGGVGLGLSIAKSIIEKHYGSIWAESEGEGSTFHIALPKLKAKKEA